MLKMVLGILTHLKGFVMKMRTKIISVLAVVAAASGAVACAKSNNHMRSGMNPAQHEAAIAACAGKTEGTAVRFEHPMWGAVDAVCAKSPHNNTVRAMPAKMVAHIQASQAACVGKKDGDAVQVTSMMDANKQLEATCTKMGDTLAAHPKGMKHGKRHGDMHGM
jgi:hypothetical protein